MHNRSVLSAVKEQAGGATFPGASAQKARWLALLCLCLGFAMIILDANLVNVALPTIYRDLGGGPDKFLWFVNIYSLIFASLLLTSGTLGDRLGAKRIFLVGLTLFMAASLANSLAPRMEILIVTRALQGLGAALLTPSSLALIMHIYPEARERARAVSIYSAVSGVGFISGPLLSGLLIESFGWRSVFLLNVPIGIVAIALAARFVTAPPRASQRSFDPPGQVLAIFALVSLVYALIESKQAGWTAWPILVGVGLFVSAAVLFIIVERRSKNPILPLKLFTSVTFTVANITAYFYSFGLYGISLVLTLFLQNIQRISAAVTGLMFLPLSITYMLTTLLIAGPVMARTGLRLPLALGTAGCGLGAIMIIWIDSSSSPVLLLVALIAFGFGIGMTMPAMTAAVLASVQASQAGIGSAVLNTSRQVGGVLGPVLSGTLVTSTPFLTGMHSALLIVTGGFVLCFFLTLLFVPRDTDQGSRRSQDEPN